MNLIHIFVIYLFLILLFNIDKKRCQKVLIFLSLFGLNFIVWNKVFQPKDWMEVMFFDVGQGDAALIKCPTGKYIIIDGGNNTEYFNAAERHIVPYLKRSGIKKIDDVFLSHADTDHIAGAVARTGGGAVIARIEASAARTFAQRLGVENLLENLVGTGGVLYLVYREEPDGLVAEASWDGGPVPSRKDTGRKLRLVRDRSAFEVDVGSEPLPGHRATLRIGWRTW